MNSKTSYLLLVLLLALEAFCLTSGQVALDCNFEQGNLCGWNSTGFSVGTPTTQIPSFYLPAIDHAHSRSGHFAYVFNAKDAPQTVTLQAPNPYGKDQGFCMEFYYYFYAEGRSNFELTLDGPAGHVPIYRAFSAIEAKWHLAQIGWSPDEQDSTITFSAKVAQGILAIDDIQVSEGECEQVDQSRRCDFELKKKCYFTPTPNPGLPQWIVYQGSEFHLPDHTTHTPEGHFYGLNLSSVSTAIPANQKTQFQIGVSKLDGTTYACLKFSYIMVGVAPSTVLTAKMVDADEDAEEEEVVVWKTAANTGGAWLSHREILIESEFVDLQFTVETHGQPVGVVFVDDFAFETQACPRPDACDFERGDLCTLEPVLSGGRVITNSEAKLTFAKAATFAKLETQYLTDWVDSTWHVFEPRQSPKFVQHDHTKSLTGKYLLLTGRNPSDRGVVITGRYPLSNGGACLSFYVYKPEGSILEVYQGEPYSDTFGLKLWDYSAAPQDWVHFEIQAIPHSKDSVDVFFYIVGTVVSTTSYIAVDDISLKAHCVNPVNSLNPPTTPSPVTNPPVTNPPVTNPPVTNPPVTNPPVTNAPATNPPVTNPPPTNPPATNPPTTPHK